MDYIIDAHTHIFPQKIADKAVASIGHFYNLDMHERGTAEALLAEGVSIKTARYLVCSTATTPAQVAHINDFIYEECQQHSQFIGFATLHPGQEDIGAEFERILERGFYGIKLHPDFQAFNIDDERAAEIYRRAEGKLAILFHTGDDRFDYSAPSRLAKITERFPGLVCIAAHFGGYHRWDEALRVYESPNIYMDTSSSLFTLPVETAQAFFERFGYDHFFFGTDFPMWSHYYELKRFNKLGLAPDARRMLLADNFRRVILKEDV